ncbi:MAG: hypothetical protein SNI12_08755, partial [Rikenellaceae bacterium]
MTTQQLTYSAVVEMMDKSYTLVYLDHSNNLDSHTQIIGDCIRAKSPDTLFEQIGYWYDEAESGRVAEIIEELKAVEYLTLPAQKVGKFCNSVNLSVFYLLHSIFEAIFCPKFIY